MKMLFFGFSRTVAPIWLLRYEVNPWWYQIERRKFRYRGVERVLSSCSNESSNMSPRTIEGTPTSMKAIREMNGDFQKDKKSEKKKKKRFKVKRLLKANNSFSLFSKDIFNLKQKFSGKKQSGDVRVGTPEGEWRFNQSLSPSRLQPNQKWNFWCQAKSANIYIVLLHSTTTVTSTNHTSFTHVLSLPYTNKVSRI